jgi:hypothetical protein
MIRTRVQAIVLNIVTVVVGIPSMLLTIGLLTHRNSTLLQWVVADIAGVLAMGLSTWLTMVLGTCIESVVIRCVGRRPESTEGGEELRDRL